MCAEIAPSLRSGGVVDLHTHVLPGIDDGPPDVVGSVAMADIAAADGVSVMVATPHVRNDHPAVVPGALAGMVRSLNATLARYAIDLQVAPGGEVDVNSALTLDQEALRLVTIGQNGSDLLVETPHAELPEDFGQLIGAVQDRGFRVTLAHPELNRDIQKRPERLERLVADGVLVQITASSLLAQRRSRARTVAMLALESGWAHIVASDAHAPRWRPPTLKTQVDKAIQLRPDLAAVLEYATTDAPRAVLAGEPVPSPPAHKVRRRRLLFRR